MTFVTSCPSTGEKVGILVAVLFPLIALPMALRARRLGFALVPLLVNAAVAFLQFRHVLRGLAMTGSRSVGGLAAGLATVQEPLIAGAGSAVICVLIAAFLAWRRPSAVRSGRIARTIVVAALLLAAAGPLFTFVVARFAYDDRVALWYGVAAVAAFLFAATLATWFASRGAAVRPLLIAAASAAIIGAEAWLVLRHFAHIALTGH